MNVVSTGGKKYNRYKDVALIEGVMTWINGFEHVILYEWDNWFNDKSDDMRWEEFSYGWKKNVRKLFKIKQV